MKYFKSTDDWEFNSRISKEENKWLLHGEGFRIATELLENQILEADRSNQDFVIYPYCYLIRHYIEIKLKEVIDEGSKIKGLTISPTKGGHDLSILWRKSQEVLEEVWGEDHSEAPDNVKDFIKELHSIDVKSDNFRYPIDKAGQATLDAIPTINFKLVAKIFREVKDYLDGITDGLAVKKDNINTDWS